MMASWNFLTENHRGWLLPALLRARHVPQTAQSRHGLQEQVAKHSTNVQRLVTFSWHGQTDENEPSEAICNCLLKNVLGDDR